MSDASRFVLLAFEARARRMAALDVAITLAPWELAVLASALADLAAAQPRAPP
ncbi:MULTISPECIES: hypothetical protein [unclassified Marinovum]|uniref:hypothetical protein n=1 Tax=unclassified Marinovum TaxID=2647166 RepID=UPI003EDBFB19